jgi:hypothetical protein
MRRCPRPSRQPLDIGVSGSRKSRRADPERVSALTGGLWRLGVGGYGFLRHRPTVGVVPHFVPSGAPPPGQNTDTSVSLASQLTEPSACTDRIPGPAGPVGPVDPADLEAQERPARLERPVALPVLAHRLPPSGPRAPVPCRNPQELAPCQSQQPPQFFSFPVPPCWRKPASLH